MALPKASLDASFWINAHQAGLTPFLPEYFQLFVCSEVEFVVLLYHVGKLSYTTAKSTIGRFLGLGKHLARTALAVLGALARRKGERRCRL